jgi:hypothetical protein
LIEAAMNSTTLGCRNAVITRTCDLWVRWVTVSHSVRLADWSLNVPLP